MPCLTTGLVLLWCLVLSLLWSHLCYAWTAWRGPRLAVSSGERMILPALVLAPLALVLAFRLAGVNLLYPVTLLAEPKELALAALPPALVLMLASGLASLLYGQIKTSYHHWQAQPFCRVALALGQPLHRSLYRLVLRQALLQAWAAALPWLFGELVVVEAVFNAPGLGLEAWHLARTQEYADLALVVGLLAFIYAGAVVLTTRQRSVLGRKLASYG